VPVPRALYADEQVVEADADRRKRARSKSNSAQERQVRRDTEAPAARADSTARDTARTATARDTEAPAARAASTARDTARRATARGEQTDDERAAANTREAARGTAARATAARTVRPGDRAAVASFMPSDAFVGKFDHVRSPLAAQTALWGLQGKFLFADHRSGIVAGNLGRPPAGAGDGAMDVDGDAARLEATAARLVRAIEQEALHTPQQQLDALEAYTKQVNPKAPLLACGACGLADFEAAPPDGLSAQQLTHFHQRNSYIWYALVDLPELRYQDASVGEWGGVQPASRRARTSRTTPPHPLPRPRLADEAVRPAEDGGVSVGVADGPDDGERNLPPTRAVRMLTELRYLCSQHEWARELRSFHVVREPESDGMDEEGSSAPTDELAGAPGVSICAAYPSLVTERPPSPLAPPVPGVHLCPNCVRAHSNGEPGRYTIIRGFDVCRSCATTSTG